MGIYLIIVFTAVIIYAIMALGLNVQWGLTGLFNLSGIAFMAIGAYTVAILTVGAPNPSEQYIFNGSIQAPFVVAVLVAMVVCAVGSTIVGLLALTRVRSYYFAIITLAIGQIAYTVVNVYQPLANGYYGIVGIPQPFFDIAPGGYQNYPYFFLALCLGVLAVVFLVVERMRKSPFGRVLRAVREDQIAASAFGRNVVLLQLRAFVIGSVILGLGGALLSVYVGAFTPGEWSLVESFLLYSAVFLGGSGNNYGALLGALMVVGIINEGPNFVRIPFLTDQQILTLQAIASALLLIVVLAFRRQGVLPERASRDN